MPGDLETEGLVEAALCEERGGAVQMVQTKAA